MIRDACTRTRFSVVTLTRSTGTSTLSLHDALPILLREMARAYLRLIGEAGLTGALFPEAYGGNGRGVVAECIIDEELAAARSEEHTSELQSHHDLVCRVLLEKKNSPTHWLAKISPK